MSLRQRYHRTSVDVASSDPFRYGDVLKARLGNEQRVSVQNRQMDDLVQLGHSQALYWTELVYGAFRSRGQDLPPDWPGSFEQARLLVAVAANGRIEESHCEQLVDIVQHRARFLWQQFRTFY
jgi:hypothetical protein